MSNTTNTFVLTVIEEHNYTKPYKQGVVVKTTESVPVSAKKDDNDSAKATKTDYGPKQSKQEYEPDYVEEEKGKETAPSSGNDSSETKTNFVRAYISTKPVPPFVRITDTRFWMPIPSTVLEEEEETVEGGLIHKGSIAFSEIPTPSENNFGWVYTITDDYFITNSNFVNINLYCNKDTDIVCMKTPIISHGVPTGNYTYKWEILGGSYVMPCVESTITGSGHITLYKNRRLLLLNVSNQTITFTLSSGTVSQFISEICVIYFFVLQNGHPTIIWPQGIHWANDEDAPDIEGGYAYEITIGFQGVATCIKTQV